MFALAIGSGRCEVCEASDAHLHQASCRGGSTGRPACVPRPGRDVCVALPFVWHCQVRPLPHVLAVVGAVPPPPRAPAACSEAGQPQLLPALPDHQHHSCILSQLSQLAWCLCFRALGQHLLSAGLWEAPSVPSGPSQDPARHLDGYSEARGGFDLAK